MPRKILIGLLIVALACALFGSGYVVGQYLAQRERSAATPGASGQGDSMVMVGSSKREYDRVMV